MGGASQGGSPYDRGGNVNVEAGYARRGTGGDVDISSGYSMGSSSGSIYIQSANAGEKGTSGDLRLRFVFFFFFFFFFFFKKKIK
jgi:hypothetical protein